MRENSTGKFENELKECKDINVFIEKNKDCFIDLSAQVYLNKQMLQKGITKKEVVKNCGLDPIYAYQILSGRKNGERDKWLCIAYAAQLSLEETNRLLYCAGKSKLYPKAKRDAILIFGFHHHLTVPQVDDRLYDAQEKTLIA